MRDTLRLLGIIALAVIFGISMGACDNGSTSDSGDSTPVASDYTVIGGGVQTYTGSPIVVTITPKAGKSQGAVTVLYDGSSTPKSAIGSYQVTFDVAAASGWKAAQKLAGGILVISNSGNLPTPVAGDYSVSGRQQAYNGEPKRVNIVPIPGKSNGAVYNIRYNGNTAEPTLAGTYDILFDVEGTESFQSAKDLSGGQMVISESATGSKITPVLEDFVVIGLGTFPYTNDNDTTRWVFVEAKPNKTGGTITVKYNGSTDKPREVKTYLVTFDVTESGPYSATTIEAGYLTITAGKEIELSFFDISGLSQEYDGSGKKVIVTPRVDHQKLDGKVTVRYQGQNEVPSLNLPYQVGTYKIFIDVAAVDGYLPTSEPLEAEDLVIGASKGSAAPPASAFTVAGLGTYSFDASLPKIVSVRPVDNKYSGQITVIYTRRDGGGEVPKPVNAGTYDVSYRVTPSIEFGATTIPAGELTIYQLNPYYLDDYVVLGGPYTYDGTAHPAIVSSATLGSAAQSDISVLYDGSSAAPVDVGEYKVSFNLRASTNWQAASNIEVAQKLIIKKGNPKYEDYAVVQAVGQPYSGVAIAVPASATRTTVGLAVSDGEPEFTYNGAAALPINADTYTVVMTIPKTDNWDEATYNLNSVTITPRVTVNADFVVTGLSWVAYNQPFVAPVFRSNPDRVPTYPTLARQPNITYYNKATGARVQAMQNAAPGTYTASITLGAVANWTNPTLSWDYEVTDKAFLDELEFVKWLNARTNNTAATAYSVKFGYDGTTRWMDTDKLARIVQAINDDGTVPITVQAEIDAGIRATNNKNKYLKIDLGEALATAAFPADYGLRNCLTIVELDLSKADSSVVSIGTNGTTFDGCSNLTVLKLPIGLTALPGNALRDCAKLTTLDTGGLESLEITDFDLRSGGQIKLTEVILRKVAGTVAFKENEKLKKVTITGDATNTGAAVTIAEEAFKDCSSLETFIFDLYVNPDTGANTDWGTTDKTIGASAFSGCSRLVNFTFPKVWSSVAGSIGDRAFENCTSLVDLNIPNLKAAGATIHGDAFKGVPLKTITLGSGTGSITNANLLGVGVFKEKPSLETVNLLVGVTALPEAAFKDCTNLKTVNFPGSGFTSIGISAFEGCSSLASITVPSPLTTLGTSAFKKTTALKSITLPSLTNPVPANCFEESGLTSVTIPNSGITGINASAFKNCKSLVSVKLNVTADPFAIAASAFEGCNNLTDMSTDLTAAGNKGKVVLPSNATIVADSFKNCTSISYVKIITDAASYPGAAFTGCTGLKTLEIGGSSVTAINFGTGSSNNITSIETIIWDSTDSILAATPAIDFRGCTGLKELVVKQALTAAIAANLFVNNDNGSFKTLRIEADQTADLAVFGSLPNSVTNVIVGVNSDDTAIALGDSTALFNPKVNYIEFTGLIGTIATDAFNNLGAGTDPGITVSINADPGATNLSGSGCGIAVLKIGKDTPLLTGTQITSAKLERFDIDSGNAKMGNYGTDGVLYQKSSTGSLNNLVLYPPAKKGDTYDIAPGVESIGPTAFGTSTVTLKSLTIPASVRTIGTGAISGLQNPSSNDLVITYAAVSASVAGGASLFPTFLKNLIIANGVRVIPAIFLGANDALTTLTIPASVTTITDGAISGAAAITDVNFNATNYQGVEIFAFTGTAGDETIKRVTFGPGVSVVRKGMFKDQVKLVFVSLPDTITSIEEEAFNGCEALNRVAIPANVISIGKGAFVGCIAMGELIFKGSTTGFVDGTFNTAVASGGPGVGDGAFELGVNRLAALYGEKGKGWYKFVYEAATAGPPAVLKSDWSYINGVTSFD